MCKLPEEYKYLSVQFYNTGIDNPSASSGGISYTSSGKNYRPVVGGDTSSGSVHQPRRKTPTTA